MQTTLKNKKKVEFLKIDFRKKNKAKEGGASGLGVKRE
jgi:hypothetical protein